MQIMSDLLTGEVGMGNTWLESITSTQFTSSRELAASIVLPVHTIRRGVSQEEAVAKLWFGVVAAG